MDLKTSDSFKKFEKYPANLQYIIDHYNPSARIIDLVSHTTYVVCVNFILKCRGTTV